MVANQDLLLAGLLHLAHRSGPAWLEHAAWCTRPCNGRTRYGTRDANVPYGVALDAAKRIPNSRMLTIGDGTHMLVATHAQALRTPVEQFQQRLDREV